MLKQYPVKCSLPNKTAHEPIPGPCLVRRAFPTDPHSKGWCPPSRGDVGAAQNKYIKELFLYTKLDTRISVLRSSRSGDPPWILKRGGLESSGRIPSS